MSQFFAELTSYEILKLIVQILTPVTVLGLGWYFNQRLKKIDFRHWSNQKVIEKRLKLYDEIAPKLNMLLCFYIWKGDWKNISPDHVLEAKRELDKTLIIYKYLFDDSVFSSYESYIELLFETYSKRGASAKLLTGIDGPGGNREHDGSYVWKKEWDNYFSRREGKGIKAVSVSYESLMNNLRASIGLSKENGS